MKYRFDLGAALMALGMKEPFSGNADFSAMDGGRDLNIDQAIHEATVEVDEQGTEAVAVTGFGVVYISKNMKPPPKYFYANRPFLFIIRDKELNSFLFIGRLVNPKAG